MHTVVPAVAASLAVAAADSRQIPCFRSHPAASAGKPAAFKKRGGGLEVRV
jgi:hypothetical protein